MLKHHFVSITVAATVAASFVCAPVAMAQTAADTAASTPSQIKKAQRKQAHAKKNAELSQLEKNGYKPNSDDATYPTDIQNAERKTHPAQPGAASAP
jgi:Ni/Co efflux regulator RcnB